MWVGMIDESIVDWDVDFMKPKEFDFGVHASSSYFTTIFSLFTPNLMGLTVKLKVKKIHYIQDNFKVQKSKWSWKLRSWAGNCIKL